MSGDGTVEFDFVAAIIASHGLNLLQGENSDRLLYWPRNARLGGVVMMMSENHLAVLQLRDMIQGAVRTILL